MTDYDYMERSTIFEYFVEAFPNSMIGKDFRRNGLKAIEQGGTFRTALYEGDLDKCLLYADKGNQTRLMLILRDRKGYSVLQDELGFINPDEYNLEKQNGEREMHWGDIMEEIRENKPHQE